MEQIRSYAQARDAGRGKKICRLYCVEGNLSLTGANADYRLRLRPDLQPAFLAALLREVLASGKAASGVDRALQIPAGPSLSELAGAHGMDRRVLEHLVDDLLAHQGTTVIFGGAALSEDAQVLVNALNHTLNNEKLFADVESCGSAGAAERGRSLCVAGREDERRPDRRGHPFRREPGVSLSGNSRV